MLYLKPEVGLHNIYYGYGYQRSMSLRPHVTRTENPIRFGHEQLEQVDTFPYLGSLITEDGECTEGR